MTGQEETALTCARGGLSWIYVFKGWQALEQTGAVVESAGGDLKAACLWHLETRFRGAQQRDEKQRL